ncbi:hypothetical protein [Ramlibacter sp.]|uniref:hypothetical protein n=1 Tax=Ramlibacter sp. TaxID=1917967 RepID=UPI002C47FB26|nr:hypothetical protein [Ramlibacter sp.]HWI82678.1 hypothetical protein [Ramlibacter sp.]
MPIDSTPEGAELMHQPAQPRYPEPKPGQQAEDDPAGATSAEPDRAGAQAPAERPDPRTGAGADVAG